MFAVAEFFYYKLNKYIFCIPLPGVPECILVSCHVLSCSKARAYQESAGELSETQDGILLHVNK